MRRKNKGPSNYEPEANQSYCQDAGRDTLAQDKAGSRLYIHTRVMGNRWKQLAMRENNGAGDLSPRQALFKRKHLTRVISNLHESLFFRYSVSYHRGLGHREVVLWKRAVSIPKGKSQGQMPLIESAGYWHLFLLTGVGLVKNLGNIWITFTKAQLFLFFWWVISEKLPMWIHLHSFGCVDESINWKTVF